MRLPSRKVAARMLAISLVLFGLGLLFESTLLPRGIVALAERATGWQIGFVHSRISLLRGLLEIETFGLDSPDGKITLDGEKLLIDLSFLSLLKGQLIVSDLQLESPRLFMDLPPKDPDRKPDVPKIIRKIFSTLPRLENSLALQNIVLKNVTIQNARIYPRRFEEAGGRLLGFGKAQITSESNLFRELQIHARLEDPVGFLRTVETLEAHLEIKNDRITIKRFLLDSEKVNLEARSELKGHEDDWKLSLDGTLKISSVLSDTLSVSVEAIQNKKAKEIEVKKIEGHLGQAHLEGHGTFDPARLSYSLPFVAKDLPLEAIFKKINSFVVGPAQGMAEVTGEAQGTLPEFSATAKATLRDVRHTVIAVRQATGTLDFKWPQLNWDAHAFPDDGQEKGTVKGGVYFESQVDDDGRKRMHAFLKSVEIKTDSALLQNLFPTLKVTGQLSGNLRLEGVKEKEGVKGTGHAIIRAAHWPLGPIDLLESDIVFQPVSKISFSQGDLKIPGLPPVHWASSIDLDTASDRVIFTGQPLSGLSFKGFYVKESGDFHIDSFRLNRDGGDVLGSYHLLSNGKLTAQLKGQANLEWLLYFPELFHDTEGLAAVNFNVTGTMANPIFDGLINFGNLGNHGDVARSRSNTFGLRGLAQVFSNLEGTLSLKNNTLKPNLSGQLGEGGFKLQGQVGLDGWRPKNADLSLIGSNLTLSQSQVYRLDFDADLTLKGSFPSPTLGGEIAIVDGRYYKYFVVSDFLIKPTQEVSVSSSEWQDSLNPINLNLSIKNSGDLKIDNNVANILFQSNLQINGTYGHPRVLGVLNASEGDVHFLGSDFSLNSARLEYIDPSRSEPYLIVTAQQDIPPANPAYSVLINVKGFLSNLQVDLSSTPSLPREDILSLIAFGGTREDINKSTVSRRTMTTALLAEGLSSVIERPFSKKTGLDIFRLEASERGTFSLLSLGKKVTDRLSVELRNDFAPETAERTIQANYYLTDNILLKGFRSQSAGAESRYQFNISFRFQVD